MPTLVNNLRAIRGPVTAVPMVGQSGVVVEPDTANNQVVVRADETVLSNGQSSSTSPITLSESMSNFEYVEIYAVWNYNSTQQMTVYSKISGDSTVFSLCGFACANLAADTQDTYLLCSDFSVSGATITVNKVLRQNNAGSLLSRTDGIVITKIVGINRIANN